MKYFSYDPTYKYGFNLHKTEKEAKQRAAYALQDYMENNKVIDHFEISQICWGEVKERVIKHILTDGEEQLISYCIQDPDEHEVIKND